jgi:hypothetical protein
MQKYSLSFLLLLWGSLTTIINNKNFVEATCAATPGVAYPVVQANCNGGFQATFCQPIIDHLSCLLYHNLCDSSDSTNYQQVWAAYYSNCNLLTDTIANGGCHCVESDATSTAPLCHDSVNECTADGGGGTPGTDGPSLTPSLSPSKAPKHPSKAPSRSPSKAPSRAPSRAPKKPSRAPSRAPKKPSRAPSLAPKHPSHAPSRSPSHSPTTSKPSASPTTSKPSASPTTSKPSTTPTTSMPSSSPSHFVNITVGGDCPSSDSGFIKVNIINWVTGYTNGAYIVGIQSANDPKCVSEFPISCGTAGWHHLATKNGKFDILVAHSPVDMFKTPISDIIVIFLNDKNVEVDRIQAGIWSSWKTQHGSRDLSKVGGTVTVSDTTNGTQLIISRGTDFSLTITAPYENIELENQILTLGLSTSGVLCGIAAKLCSGQTANADLFQQIAETGLLLSDKKAQIATLTGKLNGVKASRAKLDKRCLTTSRRRRLEDVFNCVTEQDLQIDILKQNLADAQKVKIDSRCKADSKSSRRRDLLSTTTNKFGAFFNITNITIVLNDTILMEFDIPQHEECDRAGLQGSFLDQCDFDMAFFNDTRLIKFAASAMAEHNITVAKALQLANSGVQLYFHNLLVSCVVVLMVVLLL